MIESLLDTLTIAEEKGGTGKRTQEATNSPYLVYSAPRDPLFSEEDLETLPPITALLRTLEMKHTSEYWTAMDDWLTSTTESSSSSLLSSYDFIMSTSIERPEAESTSQVIKRGTSDTDKEIQSPNEYLGSKGRDLEDSYAADFDINGLDEAVRVRSLIAAHRKGASLLTEEIEEEQLNSDQAELARDGENLLYCYLHERVARKLKKKKFTMDFVLDLIGKRIIEGALIRNEHQYKKKVNRDVREVRLNEKERVLYARQGRAILILDIVFDHKLQTPIATCQREMDVMKTWMKANKHTMPEDEPFVIVDSVTFLLCFLFYGSSCLMLCFRRVVDCDLSTGFS